LIKRYLRFGLNKLIINEKEAIEMSLSLFITGFLIILFVACSSNGNASKRIHSKPNIIFILADDLGYGDLGCYGQTELQTPNIDRMASEGIRFTQVYCGAPVCAPSRSVLLTGQHTGHTTVRNNTTTNAERVPLRDEDITFAEIVIQAGYVTGIFGKWHLARPYTSGVPLRQGFDEHFGQLSSKRYKNSNRKDPSPYMYNGKIVNLAPQEYNQDLYMNKALDFIDRHQDRPFLLYLSFNLPHAHSGERMNKSRLPHNSLYSEKDWPDEQKHYATLVTRMDQDVGRVFGLLKELNINKETIVFFSSDNGPHKEDGNDPEFFNSNGNLRGIKRDLYEGGIRVPMIIRWPEKIKAGRVSDYIWAFWDVLPTIAEIAGVESPQAIDGISILPVFLGETLEPHKYLYWEFYQGGFKQASRMGKWKALRFTQQGLPLELYDLEADPGEQQNVASIIQKL
jgi:arylsulfatase A-like enzyme